MELDCPDINDPVFRHLTVADLEEDARNERRLQEWRRKEAAEILVGLRKEVGSAFVALSLIVLEPVCYDCRYQLGGGSSQIVRVWPQIADGRLRLYDRGDLNVYFFDDNKPETQGYAIICDLCQNSVTGINDSLDIVPAIPIAFSTYFGLNEVGPKRARGKAFRKWLAGLYGDKCFHCERPLTQEDLTLDHIVARAKGGQSVPSNLQVLCEKCNHRKKDNPVFTLELALDFPLRPAPSDSYEGLVW
jgi:5-methylcytosine-specific restriction endonuclease McrA